MHHSDSVHLMCSFPAVQEEKKEAMRHKIRGRGCGAPLKRRHPSTSWLPQPVRRQMNVRKHDAFVPIVSFCGPRVLLTSISVSLVELRNSNLCGKTNPIPPASDGDDDPTMHHSDSVNRAYGLRANIRAEAPRDHQPSCFPPRKMTVQFRVFPRREATV